MTLPPLRILCAAGPDAPGMDALVEAALRRAGGGAVSMMFTGQGLRFLAADGPAARLAAAGAHLALCSRSVRDHPDLATAVPATVAWSSLTVWLGEAPADAETWAAFP